MIKSIYGLLHGKKIIPCDMETWATSFRKDESHILRKTKIGEKTVSTVFLGIDHAFCNDIPLWFETMVFPESDICERYTTYEEAIDGHEKIVNELGNIHG
jgi:hypothetical protein